MRIEPGTFRIVEAVPLNSYTEQYHVPDILLEQRLDYHMGILQYIERGVYGVLSIFVLVIVKLQEMQCNPAP